MLSRITIAMDLAQTCAKRLHSVCETLPCVVKVGRGKKFKIPKFKVHNSKIPQRGKLKLVVLLACEPG